MACADWSMAVFALVCAKQIWAQTIKSIEENLQINHMWGKIKTFVLNLSFFVLLLLYRKNKRYFYVCTGLCKPWRHLREL